MDWPCRTEMRRTGFGELALIVYSESIAGQTPSIINRKASILSTTRHQSFHPTSTKLWAILKGGWPNIVYADFEVCPLEDQKPEAMQAACIESAKNITIKNDH